MKTKYIGIVAVLVVLLGAAAITAWLLVGNTDLAQKVYVAVEGEGTIAVLDPRTNKTVKSISLTDEATGTTYLPHNVQASPDGSTVWVTANAGMDEHTSFLIPVAHADEGHADMNMGEQDQVIIIDPVSDTVSKRIPLGSGQHLSHVVLSADSETAVIAAQETGRLYVLGTRDYSLKRTITLPEGSGPHGMRLSPNGKTAYVAFMEGNGLGIVDLDTGSVSIEPLSGSVVQTAITPDGKFVAASVYEPRAVALYDTGTKAIAYVNLPEGAQGPVQLYPTPDSRSIYVADQGVLEGRPANNKLYKLDLESQLITGTTQVGSAPHGVVLNRDGTRAYVTNLGSGTVSVVDLGRGVEIARVSVGEKPNGITYWEASAVPVAKDSGFPELAGVTMEVYKSPSCSCCGGYINALKSHGVNVVVHEITESELSSVKDRYGVSADLRSCHTTVVEGYVVEGHVPLEAVAKLLTEKPDIAGIALPGMPIGTPGMEGPKTEPFRVHTLSGDGYVTI